MSYLGAQSTTPSPVHPFTTGACYQAEPGAGHLHRPFCYQTRLNSVTGGHGSYTLELSHYDAVPPGVQKDLMAQYKPRPEE